MHVQVCTLDGCCEHQRTHLLTRLQQDVHMRLCMCSLAVCSFSVGGTRMWGFKRSMKALVAWHGGLFLTEGRIRVWSVSSLFLTRAGVYVGVCVCIRTHTHTHCTDGVLGCEPRSQDKTPGGTEESRNTKSRHIYSYMCTKYTCVCIC